MELRDVNELADALRLELGKAVVGQDRVLDEMICVLLAGGHGLLEGVPGTAKTLMVRALARVVGGRFRRVQFTPDLLPSDILGVSIYNTAAGDFVFRQGPIFTDLVLADEINRAPAKTQAALLEAMQERQATVDGVSHALSGAFTVFATQNPVEFEGTYPLPEAQVDRFMLKILVDYPSEDLEGRILDRVEGGFDDQDLDSASLREVTTIEQLAAARLAVRSVRVEEMVRRYVTRIVRSTRSMHQILLGASPRSGVMLLLAAKAAAVLAGRDFVTPDDVKSIATPVLRHRITLRPEFEIEGWSSDHVLHELLNGVEVPR